jgi:serine/threonine protein kinase
MISQRLDHPNIVRIYDLYEEEKEGEKHTYLVMEWIEGKTLDQVARGSLTKQQALKDVYSLIDVLIYALEQGYIHEDLYSANLMIDREGNLKLIDLNSFSELEEGNSEQNEDTTNNRHYLTSITTMVISILNCGPLSGEQSFTLRSKIENHLAKTFYAYALDQPLCCHSIDPLIFYLNEMKACLAN